jgi:hypothetical protein
MSTAKTYIPKSFPVDLNDIHCVVHFIMLPKESHKKHVSKTMTYLNKFGYFDMKNREETREYIDKTYQECSGNPGFTFEIDTTDIIICLRTDMLPTKSYFISISAHEISHAITILFNNLGVGENDEMRAIYMGNMVEDFISKSKILDSNLQN